MHFFLFFPLWGCCVGGVFLFFYSFSPFIRAGCLLLYICTRTHAGGGGFMGEGWDHPPRAGVEPSGCSMGGSVEQGGGGGGAGGRSSGRGVPGEGPGHICGPNGPRCRHRARSVAATFACEMGVFCGEVRLKISILGVFLAVERGSKHDWCEYLLIFFRKWLGDMRCFFVYYARR